MTKIVRFRRVRLLTLDFITRTDNKVCIDAAAYITDDSVVIGNVYAIAPNIISISPFFSGLVKKRSLGVDKSLRNFAFNFAKIISPIHNFSVTHELEDCSDSIFSLELKKIPTRLTLAELDKVLEDSIQ